MSCRRPAAAGEVSAGAGVRTAAGMAAAATTTATAAMSAAATPARHGQTRRQGNDQ
jgi:hypothetical protein